VKFHDTKNKLLFERLTDQFSGGEIEENFFSKMMDQVKKSAPVTDAEKKLVALKKEFPDATADVQADNAQDALKSQAEKLEQFANQTLMLLYRSGIDKEEQIFKDIVKSMNTALDTLKPSDAEVDDAAKESGHPQDWPPHPQQGEDSK
jgi:hypothetical protein